MLHFNAFYGVIPCEYPDKLYLSAETRMFVLPDAENRTIVYSFFWTKHRNVTDGQTDTQTEMAWLLQRSALRAMRTRARRAHCIAGLALVCVDFNFLSLYHCSTAGFV